MTRMAAQEGTSLRDGVDILLGRKSVGHLFSLRDEIRKDPDFVKFHELSIYIQFARILRIGAIGISRNTIPSDDVAFVLSVVTKALHKLDATGDFARA